MFIFKWITGKIDAPHVSMIANVMVNNLGNYDWQLWLWETYDTSII